MNSIIIVALIIVYSNVVTVIITNDVVPDGWRGVTAAVGWPIFVPVAVVMVVYGFFVRTPKRIKDDIRNRRLMKEFNEFMDARKDNGND